MKKEVKVLRPKVISHETIKFHTSNPSNCTPS